MFDIEKEIVAATIVHCEINRLPVPRFMRLKTAPRPWYTEDTRAEDERLDDPRHGQADRERP